MQNRILIVDDEKPLAQTLNEILSSAGYQCAMAFSADHALECMQTFDPALVITDVIMPGMNGIELAKILLAARPGCKVLLYSGNAATEELLEGARDEGHEFPILAKPVHPLDLLATIAQVLQNRASLGKAAG